MEHELGDLLTAVVELARTLGLDAEEALQKANDRFLRRFSLMEKKARSEGRELGDMSFEEMNRLWEEAKRELGEV